MVAMCRVLGVRQRPAEKGPPCTAVCRTGVGCHTSAHRDDDNQQTVFAAPIPIYLQNCGWVARVWRADESLRVSLCASSLCPSPFTGKFPQYSSSTKRGRAWCGLGFDCLLWKFGLFVWGSNKRWAVIVSSSSCSDSTYCCTAVNMYTVRLF